MPTRNQFLNDADFTDALRDWFAGLALVGILASPNYRAVYIDPDDPNSSDDDAKEVMHELAWSSYDIAESMLSYRKDGP